MSTPDYLQLNSGITHWAEDSFGENLKYSVIDFYKWTFLNIGAYNNISINPPVSGVFGGNRFGLAYTEDPRFSNGRVWQGARSDWVWETGVSFTPPPTSVSVTLNGIPQSSGYYVDYPRGRVVFNTAIPSGSTVQATYATRSVNFVDATEPWFRELMFDSYDVQRSDFTDSKRGGKWNQLGENRLQLPVVGVEVVGPAEFKPYQLGGGQWVYVDLLYYIYAENSSDRDKLRDIIANQNNKVIWTYDRNRMKQDSRWPFTLDSRGATVSGFLTYPSLINEQTGFRFLNAKFTETNAYNMDTNNAFLWAATVRTTAEMITPYG